MFIVQLVVTVLTIPFLAQTTFTYELQDTIKKLRGENAYLHHRLENLTQALHELRKLLDHSKGHEFSEPSVNHDGDQLHAWNEWIHNAFSIKPKDVVGALNRPLMLYCAVYDTSPQTELSVKWEKENGALSAGVHQLANGSLFFSSLIEENLGGYICSARKGSKQIRSSLTVSKALTNGPIQFYMSHRRVLPEDEGFYYCEANNGKERLRSQPAYLLPAAPPSVTIWPLAVISTVGAEVIIQCQVSGHPVPSIDWLKRGQSVKTGGKITKGINKGEKGKYKDLLKTPGPQSVFPYSKLLETRTQKRHALVTPANLITQRPDEPMLHWSHMKPLSLSSPSQTFKHILLQGPSDQHTSSQEALASTSSLAQAHEITQTSGFTLYNKNSITSTTPIKVHQYWNQPAEQFTATKASQANNTELVEMLNKNTSKAPMRTTDNNARAFEDDNMVAVIEQSPNISEIRAHPPTSSPSTLLMESCYGDTQEEGQPSQDMPVIVETHPEPCEEEQLETSFEDGKVTPSLPSDIQLQCSEDWKSHDFRQCQRDAPSPPPSNPVGTQEEGLRSSLTLQTSDSSTTPVHHSISLSHASCPLMLSHCVTLGLTSVAVDVHFYPSTTTQYGPLRPQRNSRHEHDQSALSKHHSK
ncbi:roundabout-like 1-like [Silurus asotus]|uniref:Roundabout-like 1-like n=1 Tax=Silurus asotus TaxID=30991 RepID=A0AAD5AB96_SILAS|nr:roundabout-like 1-like [Silurus asotus]